MTPEINYESVFDVPALRRRSEAEKVKTQFIDEINKLSGKSLNELNPQERKLIEDAKNFAELLEERSRRINLYKKQSTELRNTLAQYTEVKNKITNETGNAVADIKEDINPEEQQVDLIEEGNEKVTLHKKEGEAIAGYLGVEKSTIHAINTESFLSVHTKVSGDGYNDWKDAGYISNGRFDKTELKQLNQLKNNSELGEKLKEISELKNKNYSIKDILNTKNLLEQKGVDGIYDVLFDINSDGNIDKADNKNINNFANINAFVEHEVKQGREENILKSFSHILNTNISSREDLFNHFLLKPEDKYKLLGDINRITGGDRGVFVTDFLTKGKDAAKISMEKTERIDKYFEENFDSTKTTLLKKYNESIEEFKLQIEKLPEEERLKYENLIQLLESQEAKDSIFDDIKLNAIGIFASFVEGKTGLGGGASFSHEKFDKTLQNFTAGIIKSLNVDVGLIASGGKMLPGIGASFDLSKDVNPELRVIGKIGVMNFIPYGIAGVEHLTNLDDLKKAGFVNISKKAQYVGGTLNVSPFGWGVMAHYRKDQLKAIEVGEGEFSKFLENAITMNGIDKEFIENLPDYEKNKTYYVNFISQINENLRQIDFENLSNAQKSDILNNLKNSISMVWRENELKRSQEKGYEFSGVGAGLQFIAGFMPLPVLGLTFSKIKTKYNANDKSLMYATLAEALDENSVSGAREVLIDHLKLSENIFEKNLPLFQDIALRHPNDWRALITGKDTNGKYFDNQTIEGKTDLIISMLKTDPKYKNTQIYKDLIQEFSTLKDSKKPEDRQRLNDLVAQFFDISFKDQRSIEETITGLVINNGNTLEKGDFDYITSRTNAVLRFSQDMGISSDFANTTSGIYKEISESKKDVLTEIRKLGYQGKISQEQLNQLHVEKQKDPTLYAFVASYKINPGTRKSLGKNMVEIPAGQVTKAGGIEKKITNQEDINFVVDNFKKSFYGQNTINDLLNTINSVDEKLQVEEQDIIKLLKNGSIERNGKTINLERDFVYFLYGRCANESLGMRLKELNFGGFKIGLKEIDENGRLRASANGANIVLGDKADIGVAMAFGDKKKRNTDKGDGGNNNGEQSSKPGSNENLKQSAGGGGAPETQARGRG